MRFSRVFRNFALSDGLEGCLCLPLYKLYPNLVFPWLSRLTQTEIRS